MRPAGPSLLALRLAAAVLVATVLLAAAPGFIAGGAAPRVSRTPEAAPPDAVELDGDLAPAGLAAGVRPLARARDELRALARRCGASAAGLPPADALRPGARLVVGSAHPPCRAYLEGLPARRRLLLGLRVDLTRAPPADLLALPGIGPATLRRLLEARRRRPFASLDDLARAGLGAKRRAQLRPLVRIGHQPSR